jgi:uncharacterized membrane protein
MHRFTLILKILAVVILTAWGGYEFGDGNWRFAVVGGFLAIYALAFVAMMRIKEHQEHQDILSASLSYTLILLPVLNVEKPIIWAIAFTINIPVYIYLVRFFFNSDNELLYILSNIYDEEADLPPGSFLRGALYIFLCVSIVAACYYIAAIYVRY